MNGSTESRFITPAQHNRSCLFLARQAAQVLAQIDTNHDNLHRSAPSRLGVKVPVFYRFRWEGAGHSINFPVRVAETVNRLAPATPIEVWFQML